MLKNRLLYLFVLLCAIVFVLAYGGKVAYVALYALVLLAIVSFCMFLFSLQALSFVQHVTETMVETNKPFTYQLTIKNGFLLPIAAVFVSLLPVSQENSTNTKNYMFSFLPKEEKNIEFALQHPFRGSYDVGMLKVCMLDWLGLFRVSIKVPKPLSVLVYPSYNKQSNLLVTNQSIHSLYAKANNAKDDPDLISDLRKYQDGDLMKKIHWKISAKKSELMVKEYEGVADNRLLLVLDNSQNQWLECMQDKKNTKAFFLHKEEVLLGGLLAFAHAALQSNVPSECFFWQSEPFVVSNMSDFQKLHALCALLPFVKNEEMLLQIPNNHATAKNQLTQTIAQMLESILSSQTAPCHMVVFTADTSAELLHVVEHARSLSHHIMIYC